MTEPQAPAPAPVPVPVFLPAADPASATPPAPAPAPAPAAAAPADPAPAATEPAPTTAAAAPAPQVVTEPGVHVVTAGDSLDTIASQYGVPARVIAAANADAYPSLGWHPLVELGWRVVIPRQTATPAP